MKCNNLNLPLFVYPIARTLGLTKYQLTNDSTAHKIVLDNIMANHLFKCAVGLMDVTLEAEAFNIELKSDGVNLPTVIKHIAPDEVFLPLSYPKRTLEYLNTMKTITDYRVMATITGPFTIASIILGFEQTRKLIDTDRNQLIQVVNIVFKYLLKYCNDLIKNGVCGIFICESMAGFLSSKDCDRFSTKYINRLIDNLEKDVYTIYHNCAKTDLIINSLVKLNVNAYHFGEATNLENVIDKLPKTKLVMGNLSPLDDFLYSDKKHVEIAILRLLDKMREHSNYQISIGCDLPYETKIENIDTYIKTTY